MQKEKYTKTPRKIKEFVHNLYPVINCLPVGQRLPVYSKNKSKEVGIISTLSNGLDIGTITTMELNSDEEHIEESVDGGHRKRAIWAFLQNQFRVPFKKEFLYFNELPKEVQKEFLDMELSFTLYKPLSTYRKGHIFRNLNKTTDVNFIEMLNSFGDIPVANYVREKVRLVDQINNPFHLLFS